MDTIKYNDISPKLAALIPPFPKGKTVTYRLLAANAVFNEVQEDNTLVSRRVETSPTYITAQCSIYDPFQETDVYLMVSKGSRLVGNPGQQQRIPNVEYIAFGPTGECTLTEQQMATYRHMELMPSNKSNVVPGATMPETGFLFERVDPEKTERELAARGRLVVKVQALLNELTEAELRALAGKLGRATDGTEDAVFNDLISVASGSPEKVFDFLSGGELKVSALIDEALSLKVIEFVGEKQQWEQTSNRAAVLQVPQGEPKDKLLEYLLGDQGQKAKIALQSAVSEAQKRKKK
ncbi:hypothetical protein [Hymenobacter latericus]|uniref:hypothetical protein n=1 Tax=Hymenobacter sp. YIM 151858-1 TaxID=2987688 RepID=UPI00222622A7|nr:hypothetical protein [Hymenobacter sp. YIM 151858-1]UYZ60097.1 hypothetical protein OIS50_04675 [Hymenobacter sp. YIM 151858-1]